MCDGCDDEFESKGGVNLTVTIVTTVTGRNIHIGFASYYGLC